MTWVPDYSNPIFDLGEAGERLQDVMRLPILARRQWLRNADRNNMRFIYRYQDFDPTTKLSMKKAEDLIVEHRLYLPSPGSFNDPYEFQAKLVYSKNPAERRKYFAKVAKRMGLKGKNLEESLGSFIRRTNDENAPTEETLHATRDRYGVACFCLDPRALRMWSHYSTGHTGICLQFDLAEDVGFAVQTLPVNYQPEIAVLRWPEDKARVVEDVLLRKWDIWKEEAEVRYTSRIIVNDHLPLSPAFLSAIILGNRLPDSSMEILDEYLKIRKFRGYPPLRLYRADRHKDRYGMLIRRLNDSENGLLPNA